MSIAAQTVDIPSALQMRRWSIAEYHRLIQDGFLTENDHVELLEGWIVGKMPKNPPHDGTLLLLHELLRDLLPREFVVRCQSSLTIKGNKPSEPEPDLLVARGPAKRYLRAHPGPPETALVIEVADTSLDYDLGIKKRIHARAGIVHYWVVNLIESTIVALTNPIAGRSPNYDEIHEFSIGNTIPIVVFGRTIGQIAVSRIFPDR